MTTTAIPLPSLTIGSATSFKDHRIAVVMLVITGLLSLTPIPILGSAIGWPGSLGSPAADQLRGIAESPTAVAIGYSLYMLYSICVLPALALAAHVLIAPRYRWLTALVTAFAALSALARCIGILRWLTVMPVLSQAHGSAGAAEKERIELVFNALNAYGGGVGELLGVSLFAGIAMLLLVLGAAKSDAVPRWLTALGFASVVSQLVLFLPNLGFAVAPPIAVAVTLLTFWMWGLAGWLYLQLRRTYTVIAA